MLGRITSLNSTGISYKYTYDFKDNIIAVEDEINKRVTRRTFNDLNQLTNETFGNGLKIYFQYDLIGRLVEVSFDDSTQINYTYNACDLISITRLNKKGIFIHEYVNTNLRGHPLQMKLMHGQNVHLQWDLLGRNIRIESPAWSQHLEQFDSNGNLIIQSQKDSSGEFSTFYTYDGLNQLTEENSRSYSYDSLGNRRSDNDIIYCINELNQLSDGIYDKNGNLLSYKDKDYTYDSLDRLVKVQTPCGVVRYDYDSFGRRLSREYNDNREFYLYLGMREIGSYKNDENVELKILGKGIGAELGATIALEIDGELYSVLSNHRNDLVCVYTNSDIPIAWHRYSAFGEQEKFGSINIPWGFSSKRYDAIADLVNFGLRDYSPNLGRWLTTDPSLFSDGVNLYHFVHNNPLVLIDPFGLESIQNNDKPINKPWYSSAWENTKSCSIKTVEFGKRLCLAGGKEVLSGFFNPFETLYQSASTISDIKTMSGWERFEYGARTTSAIISSAFIIKNVTTYIGKPLVNYGLNKCIFSNLKSNIYKEVSGNNAYCLLQKKLLKEHLRQSEQYGTDFIKNLSNGKIRYYGAINLAEKNGEMFGRRLVREWDPIKNNFRTWHETLDKNKNIRIVRPQNSNKMKKHYTFDAEGNFKGYW